MNELLHVKIKDIPSKHKSKHEGYEYYKRELVSKGAAEQCAISVYEIPPGKSAYPYHYHTKNEEAFYIISGRGLLKTPTECKEVSAGDFLFFPANEKAAHKLTNISESEALIYLDFDTYNDIDVAFYPDSGKIGIWGKNIDQIFKTNLQVEYYDGE
ncbi:cupin domain-containing protein [Clostridium sp. BL-8]|uniref:cupin domain-containing protein n=1 Tax=Clostridium sp. BL-8 TaxID=349938 RepID=UPI00098CCA29|nr:cupin domain-containing protein [Clostridium sp. BL-8]OOM77640.1 cupin domain protein [Clostridium sp. BL-8]